MHGRGDYSILKPRVQIGGWGVPPVIINHKSVCDTIKTAEKVMVTTIKLMDEQVDEISVIDSNNSYKNGQKAKDGKTFSRFRYNGMVFTVDNDNPFVKAFADGEIASVKLVEGTREKITIDSEGNESVENVPTLTFDSFVSFKQTERRAIHKAKIARYQTIATAPVTDSLLAELENA